MQKAVISFHSVALAAAWVGLVAAGAGCSASEDNSGFASPVGVASTSGGAQAVGGAASGNGGASVGNGGAATGQGGRAATGGAKATGGATASGGSTSASAPTWSQLWTNYFQGACVSCHSSTATSGNGLVFANAAQLCTLLTSRRQLNGTTNPSLISTSQSVLNWFSTNGSMPQGNNTAPANAVNDIRAWATAGAVCP